MPLPEDRIRTLERRPELPEGNPAALGAPVVYDGTDEDGDDVFILGSNPDQEIRVFSGDPNGVVFAPMGTLGVERDVPALWQNTDGVSAWSQVGGAASFPITFSDGTYTYTIEIASNAMVLKTVLNAGSVLQDRLELFRNGGTFFTDSVGGGTFFNLSNAGGFFVNDGTTPASGGSGGIQLNSTGAIQLNSTGSVALNGQSTNGSVTLQAHGTGGVTIIASGGAGGVTVANNIDSLGFYSTSPVTQQTVSGSRGGNVALANLLTALANLGLIVDSTT